MQSRAAGIADLILPFVDLHLFYIVSLITVKEVKYYLAHKYVNKIEISWFIDIELIKKSLESIKYLVLHIQVSKMTSVRIF